MALRDGIQAACSVNHVEEMVIYWMTTGSLAHPFARTVLGSSGSRRIAEANARVDLTGARPISELAVHRESLERILAEGPQSLQVILDALVEALRRDTADSENGVSASEEVRKKLCEARLKP